MRNSVRFARGRATIRTETVGPRHDPYGRTVVQIDIGNHEFSLYECGLAGEWLERDGVAVAKLEEPMPTGCLTLEEERERRGVLRAQYEAEVERLTGYTPDFWLRRLWDKVEADRHRRIPHYDDICAADAAMLSYCR